jgi:hypothetical protein
MSGRVVLDPIDAGRYLGGLAVQTLARWRVEGRGPRFFKLGSRVRYDRADLDTWLESQRRRSTSDRGEGGSTVQTGGQVV